jgi:hypothetical protein
VPVVAEVLAAARPGIAATGRALIRDITLAVRAA